MWQSSRYSEVVFNSSLLFFLVSFWVLSVIEHNDGFILMPPHNKCVFVRQKDLHSLTLETEKCPKRRKILNGPLFQGTDN